MTNGTGQFIKDYMFPKSRESAIEKISEQLGAYREIKERVEDLERRIRLLSEIRESHEGLIKTRADMVHAETVLKYIEIESTKAHLETRTQDLKKETGKLLLIFRNSRQRKKKHRKRWLQNWWKFRRLSAPVITDRNRRN